MANSNVLIIDDDPTIRDHMARLLESDGYNVVTADNALDAFDKDLRVLPDIIILDVVMPDMDGYTLLAKLRNSPETCNIKVILVSAKKEPEDRVNGLTLGADDFISKPFDSDEFRARVKNQRRILEQERERVEKEAKSRVVQFLRESLAKLAR